MKVAILGYGLQGLSAYEYWHAGNEITVCDNNKNVELPDDVDKHLGDDYLKGLNDFDLIVRSPSVHPRDIVAANSSDILNKVTSVTNEFFKVCPSKNIIGVTGTKGKGTTSTLIAKMLEASGKTVHIGGNIGTPPLDMLKAGIKPDDYVVLELANFQLIDIKYSPHIGVCLMVVPEHLDWHADVDEYVSAKQQMFKYQRAGDFAVYFGDNEVSQQIAFVSGGQKIPYYKPPGAVVDGTTIKIGDVAVCDVSELKLLGKHNWQNVCAAVTAVWQVTQNAEAIKSVLTTFAGLEHRLELVRELDGVKYYNDSFGTTPETAIVAIEAFDQPKVVILGGSDKGSNYEKLVQTVVSGNVRTVVAIGKMGKVIKEALLKAGYTNLIDGGKTMTDIVKAAQATAQAGDIVLLSTACASYDMFKNYKDRGEQFKAVVLALS